LQKSGIRHDEVDKIEREIEGADLASGSKQTVLDELEEARERQEDLQVQIDGLRNRLDEAKKWIGLTEDHFRSAISCSLRLLKTLPLQKMDGGNGSIPYYVFPPLDEREGGDPAWSDTMDTLRAPRKEGQKFWQWRRESPVRPVVFEDTGAMDDATVHLHLEHRMVQSLLGRFTAQGFIHHDLSRACLSSTKDPIPRVVLLGRLCLYGPGAARLHEVLVPVTARWIEPERRDCCLKPYAREAEAKTIDLLAEALLPKGGRPVPEKILEMLRHSAPSDVNNLLPHLEERLGAIDREMQQEPARIQALYEIQATRMEPVGLAYLWPTTG